MHRICERHDILQAVDGLAIEFMELNVPKSPENFVNSSRSLDLAVTSTTFNGK